MAKQTGSTVTIGTNGAGNFYETLHNGFNGFYTWTQLGYKGDADGPSRNGVHETLTQVMSTQAGQAWWRVNGSGQHYEFDTTPGSYSCRRLEWYTRYRMGLELPQAGATIQASLAIIQHKLAKGLSGRTSETMLDTIAGDLASQALEKFLRPRLDAAMDRVVDREYNARRIRKIA